jgi:uncharacterized sulfatase
MHNLHAITKVMAASLLLLGCYTSLQAQDRPNILWITVEDMSPNLGCYGDIYAHTPSLDRFAEESILYTNAIATAPVCAPARSTIITGMYQTAIGTHHMRNKGRLPEEVQPFTTYLRDAGYYCTNNSKEDYQFDAPADTWDESSNDAHWKKRPDAKQPFFAVFNLHTTHESHVARDDVYARDVANLPDSLMVEPGEVPLPPFYPDTELVRRDWARYYNVIAAMDRQVQALLDELEAAGLAEETIVFFYSDHGMGIPRGKRWLYETGLHVPMIVRIPEKYRPLATAEAGEKNDELVSFIDLAPTALKLAGVEVPEHMQGRAFLGENLSPQRDYAYAARDRMDERYDMIRAVRGKRYKYIRYYEPFKPYYQYMNTPEKGIIMQEIRRMEEANALPPFSAHYMADSKPQEELFDLQADPYELFNLAESPAHREILQQMRQAHVAWADETKDIGLIPEPIINALQREHDQPIYTLARNGVLPIEKIGQTARLWTEGDQVIPQLQKALTDQDASVRYWAAIGLGNLAKHAASAQQALRETLSDSSPTVTIATARALCRMDVCEDALQTLEASLRNEHEWVRLHAALVLDEIDEKARPAIPALQSVMDDENKYVVRVANRALNQLQGTENVVP